MRSLGENLMLSFDSLSLEEAAEQVTFFAQQKKKALIVTPNGSMTANALKNGRLWTLLKEAELVLADGVSIVMAAKREGISLSRVTGIDLAECLLDRAAKKGLSLFFFGGKEGIARAAREKVKKRYPDLTVSGVASGFGFTPERIAETIQTSGADIVFCCLGSPLQEEVGRYLADHLHRPVLALGGSLDVLSGNVRRAPRFFREASLEWLWRCLQSPKRFLRLFSIASFYFALSPLKKGKRLAISVKTRYNKHDPL